MSSSCTAGLFRKLKGIPAHLCGDETFDKLLETELNETLITHPERLDILKMSHKFSAAEKTGSHCSAKRCWDYLWVCADTVMLLFIYDNSTMTLLIQEWSSNTPSFFCTIVCLKCKTGISFCCSAKTWTNHWSLSRDGVWYPGSVALKSPAPNATEILLYCI